MAFSPGPNKTAARSASSAPEPASRDTSAIYHRRIDADMLAEVFESAPPARQPALYYVAGAGEMVIAVRAVLGALGVADDRI